MSAAATHHDDCDHDRYRYSGIYSRAPYGAYGVRYYDADYCYTPTAEQMATAQEHVRDYLLTVKKGRKHAASHRYISVEALRPTKKQLANYSKKQLPQPADPSQLRCVTPNRLFSKDPFVFAHPVPIAAGYLQCKVSERRLIRQ